jgi:hypothetical protein
MPVNMDWKAYLQIHIKAEKGLIASLLTLVNFGDG